MTEPTPRHNVTFPSNGATAHGYLAIPASGHGPAVVVIQEWWGLVDQLTGVCDRFAEEGFVALAPDLYGGEVTHDHDRAGELMAQLSADQAVRELSGAVDYLLGHEAVTSQRVGAVGFCMGGGFVVELARQAGDRIAAAVAYYGVVAGDLPDYSDVRAAVLAHYGDADEFMPIERVREVEAKLRGDGVDATFEIYPGAGHGFANEQDLLDHTYNAQDAEQAWQRTLAFLRRHLA